MPSSLGVVFHLWELKIVRYTYTHTNPKASRSFDFHKHAPNYLIQKTGFNRPRIQRRNSSSFAKIRNRIFVAWQRLHHFPPYRLWWVLLIYRPEIGRANLNPTSLLAALCVCVRCVCVWVSCTQCWRGCM